MKRLLCGSVVLAASLVLLSCKGDPTSDGRGEPTRILAEPTSLFIDQSSDAAVTVTLMDDQGDPLAGAFELAATGTGITVVRNEEYLGTTVGPPLVSQAQFIVTAGDTPLPSSFTLTTGELSIDIPVVVTPTVVATSVFSNATPAQNEAITVTAEGYSFLPTASAVIGGDSAIIVGNDGASLTFIPSPGGTGPAQLGDITIDFLPTAPLSIPTATEITVAPLSAAGGTDAAATAPSLPVPAVGVVAGFFDGPDFATTADHFYKLTITEAGVYTVTMDWDLGSDIDMFLCLDPPAADFSNCDFQAATGAHPEEGEFALDPGTYFVVADDFGADAAGAALKLTLQHAPPEATLRRPPPPAPRKVRK
jgi:hypothetical protein